MSDLRGYLDTQAAVGYLVEGGVAQAPVLSVSWDDVETATNLWPLLGQCTRWQVTATYGIKTLLQVEAQGISFPVGPPEISRGVLVQTKGVPVFKSEWFLEDAEAVRFFMEGLDRTGFFVLLPAVKQERLETLGPVVAFLGDKEESSGAFENLN